jgi:enoyl-CoA hydratase
VLACDIAIAGRDYAKFDSRFLQIGIHPGGGHTWRLRSIANRSTTMAMVVFSQVLRADRAKEVGLIWDVVDDADLVEEAIALAAVAAGQAKELNARTKASILTLDTIVESNQSVEHEVDPQLWSMSQPTFRTLVESLQKNISSKE